MMLIIIYLHIVVFPAHGCLVQAARVWTGCVLEVTPLQVGAAAVALFIRWMMSDARASFKVWPRIWCEEGLGFKA